MTVGAAAAGRTGRRASALRVALVLGLILSLDACSPGPEASLAAASVPADLVSPVSGVLAHIDAAGLTQVTGFTLRLRDGRVVPFRIGVLENGSVFPPGHLAEHLQSASPIRVSFRRDGADLVVYRLEDAPG